jgi:hypothetical protein
LQLVQHTERADARCYRRTPRVYGLEPLVSSSYTAVRPIWRRYSKGVKKQPYATEPFGPALRHLLEDSNLSARALARDIGRFDHAYLVRMMQSKLPVNLDHARAIQQHLGLPPDYFAEIREAAVHDLIRTDPRLRDEIYFSRVRRRHRQTRPTQSHSEN